MNKTDLLKRIAELEAKNAILERMDKEMREQFALAFNMTRPDGIYRYDSEPRAIDMSWEQIFVKIGKLLSTEDVTGIQNRIYELEKLSHSRSSKSNESVDPAYL